MTDQDRLTAIRAQAEQVETIHVTVNEFGDAVCQHGTAMDVHCCHCHSGFIFDRDHECPPTAVTDAQFIAHAREDIPWPLAQLATVTAQLAKQQAISALLQRELDLSPFCPDCRDKVRHQPCPRCRYQTAEEQLTTVAAERADCQGALMDAGVSVGPHLPDAVRALTAERDALQQRVDGWRSWAQCVWLDGGVPEGTDAELQTDVVGVHAADMLASKLGQAEELRQWWARAEALEAKVTATEAALCVYEPWRRGV